MFSLIVCIGKNRELGKKGDLVFHIKEDMKFFRETTLNHKILMGRGTWESLPNKLKNRQNIVISRHDVKNADEVVHDLTAYIEENKDTREEIFVIGGGMVYFELLPHAKNLYLTEVEATVPDADVFFPAFDKTKYSHNLITKGKDNDLAYSIVKYIKN